VGVDATVKFPLRDVPREVFSMRHRPRPSRVAEWADLVGETVGDAVLAVDGEEPDESAAENWG
jgi:hypothetical protein